MTLIGPLFRYELQRLPRRRLHLWRVIYAAALLLGLVVVYLRSFRDRSPLDALMDPGSLDQAGNAAFAETFLMAFLAVQQTAVIVLMPLYAAGSIADEKERRTFDFLLSSPLPHYQILLGKLLARLVYVGSILAVGWPVLMLTFLFGGVDFEHLLAGFAVSFITAIFLGTLGLMLACMKPNLRETLPGIVLSLLLPAVFGVCGSCWSLFSTSSPITVLVFLFEMWLTGDPYEDTTWQLVGIFAALHLPVSLVLFSIAKVATGDQTLPILEEKESAPTPKLEFPVSFAEFDPRIRRTYEIRALRYDEDPLTWKERSFHLPWFSPERGCFVMGLLSSIACFGFIALLILFAIMANALAKGNDVGVPAYYLTIVVFVSIAAVYPAFLGARVAASLGRERAGQTLLTLLALPIDRVDILKAIPRAILQRDRPFYWFLAGILTLGVLAGGVDVRGALAAALLMFGCIAWSLAFGVWLSVRVEMPTRASLIFLAVWGGVLLLPWFVSPFAGHTFGEMIELTCPPHGLLKALMVNREERSGEWLPVQAALVTSFGFAILAVAFAWDAARAFEREGK